MQNLPLILVEVLLVFGGALAFAWWQFRDLARERRKREAQRAAAADGAGEPSADATAGRQSPTAAGNPVSTEHVHNR